MHDFPYTLPENRLTLSAPDISELTPLHSLNIAETFADEEIYTNISQAMQSAQQMPEMSLTREIELDLHAFVVSNSMEGMISEATGPVIHIGFDSEFTEVLVNEKAHIKVLSLQAYVRHGQQTFTYIYYPKGPKKSDRPTFASFISNVVNSALQEGVIDEAPSGIFLYAHFIRADLGSFKDFFDFKTEADSVGGSFTSLTKPYGIDIDVVNSRRFKADPIVLKSKGNKRLRCLVRFVDTLLLTPGYASLATVGDMLDIPKREIPKPFSIERMEEYLAADPEGFEEYALRDAEIACEYGLAMHDFARNELGLNNLPATLSSAATACFLKTLQHQDGLDYAALFGVSYEQEEYWHVKKNRTQKRTTKVFTPDNKFFRPFVIDCCAGGRNEAYYKGPTPVDNWVDIDLRGAYTRGMCDIHPIDYEAAFVSTAVDDYLGHVMGFAYVKFHFPQHVRFPCLPVDAGDKGKIFPLQGESYCGAPEIALAHSLGCKMTIKHGVIYPWKTTAVRIFQPFVQWVRDRRAHYKNQGNSFYEKLVKAVGNNCYGKTYQGLQNKTGFDAKTGLSKKIGESAISSPQFAGHTTSFVRAVIGELLSRIPDDKIVTNVTTDGFICNIPLDQIDTSGPLCQRYQEICDLLYKGEHMLEKKHEVRQLIGMKTRGQLTAKSAVGENIVLAKAGYKPPATSAKDTDGIKAEQNAHMVSKYLNRAPGDNYTYSSLISMREQWLTDADLIRHQQKRLINFEYDFKRCPVNPVMQEVRSTEHIAFESKPWCNLEEFKQVRAIFDGWRRKHCLKTLDDWEHWQDYLAVKQAYQTGCGIKFLDGERSDSLLKRVFLRAYGQQAYGLIKDMKQQELADWLTAQGYPTSLDDVKSGSRNRSSLPYQIIPLTRSVIQLLHTLQQRWCHIDIASFIQKGQAEKCLRYINNLEATSPYQ
ncbi:DNA polymerase [Aliamphritea hakodatensis]|uniref:DNA polymerase n=1 Tax=Aliamphritea hakodatensis TaxID=2895352 RepID=UPI0022FD7A8B|nr:DNA polymerase [Aliamphritea hakodatensis]